MWIRRGDVRTWWPLSGSARRPGAPSRQFGSCRETTPPPSRATFAFVCQLENLAGERDSPPADERARVVDLGHNVRSAATDGVMVNHEATDRDLLLKGDAAAFAVFYDRHAEWVLGFL